MTQTAHPSVYREFIKFISKWQIVYRQKRAKYESEEIAKITSIAPVELNILVEEYRKWGIDFQKEVMPLFAETCVTFINSLAARKAIVEVARAALKERK